MLLILITIDILLLCVGGVGSEEELSLLLNARALNEGVKLKITVFVWLLSGRTLTEPSCRLIHNLSWYSDIGTVFLAWWRLTFVFYSIQWSRKYPKTCSWRFDQITVFWPISKVMALQDLFVGTRGQTKRDIFFYYIFTNNSTPTITTWIQ